MFVVLSKKIYSTLCFLMVFYIRAPASDLCARPARVKFRCGLECLTLVASSPLTAFFVNL